jgi:hypothetical protein
MPSESAEKLGFRSRFERARLQPRRKCTKNIGGFSRWGNGGSPKDFPRSLFRRAVQKLYEETALAAVFAIRRATHRA